MAPKRNRPVLCCGYMSCRHAIYRDTSSIVMSRSQPRTLICLSLTTAARGAADSFDDYYFDDDDSSAAGALMLVTASECHGRPLPSARVVTGAAMSMLYVHVCDQVLSHNIQFYFSCLFQA